MRRTLFIMMALVLVVALVPTGIVGAENNNEVLPVETDFAFVPNSGEATVSKVDLLTMEEVARYYTVDPTLNPVAYDDVHYRVARLAIDSGGNAWALNTMTGSGQSVHLGLGSVARIDADLLDGDAPTVFPLGVAGDCPRTISIVEENGTIYLWIGFWNGKYFQKYVYDPVADTLEPVAGERIDVSPATPYYAALDDNGIMWISSRNSSPFPNVTGVMGVFNFNTNDLGAGVNQLNYAPPGNQANPYSILMASDGRVWVSNGGNWNTSQIRSFAVYTYGDPDPDYCSTGIEIETEAMRGFIEYDGHIWATAISGEVLKGTFANDGCPTWEVVRTYPRSTTGGGLTGIGPDAAGNLWVVHFDENVLYGFNPETGDDLESIAVGAGPYAYENFVVLAAAELYDICGFKYAKWAGDLIPLPGWEIILEKWDGESYIHYESVFTGPDGEYCFTGLQAGEYRVSETLKPGWDQIYPAGDVYVVHLPNGAGPEVSYDFHNTPKVYCARDTAWSYGGTEADGGAELPVDAPTEGLVVRHNNKVEGNSSNSWGWTNYFDEDAEFPFTMDLYAGAGQNDITRGMLVGTVTVSYDDEEDCVTVVYNIHYPHTLLEAHAWIGPTPLPTETVTRGRREVTVVTAAPGQFDKYVEYTSVEMNAQSATFVVCGDDLKLDEAGGFWVAAHAVVEWCEPDPDAWDELEALLPE